jgi:hypothetical protein
VAEFVQMVDNAETTRWAMQEALADSDVMNSVHQFVMIDAEERFWWSAGEFLARNIQHVELVSL